MLSVDEGANRVEVDISRIQALVDRPSESLSVEIKTWIDPDEIEGQAKIVRAVLALRNYGGGFLLIGFDDTSLTPDLARAPPDTKKAFHTDNIQALISRFASDPFEVSVEYAERESQLFPVIVVPAGVRTPVAAKSDLVLAGKKLVSADDVYVRTLRSNNIPSSSKANWKDWAPLVEICFDNREADIGRFLRRHLGGSGAISLQKLSAAIDEAGSNQASGEDRLKLLLNEGEQRFQEAVEERKLTLPLTGSWEVAMFIEGTVPQHGATRDFLNLLDANNPDYTGWPVWLDSRAFADPADRPYINDGNWEALIVALDGWGRHIDFMRFDPKGRFYLRWALQDDISGSESAPISNKAFDFGLPVLRCAEAIAVGIAFAKAMGCDPEKCILQFAFRWSGLKGRELKSWAQTRRYISPGRFAHQDEVTLFQSVALDTPLSAIGGLLTSLLQPLYAVFDGFSLSAEVIEDLSSKLIERRL